MMLKKNIRTKILLSFLLLVVPSILLLNSLYYLFIANLLEEQAVKDMRQATSTLSNQLDDLIHNLDRVAINVAFSNELSRLIENNNSETDDITRFNNDLKIKNMLQQINEFSFIARNIFIYTKTGFIYDFGVNPVNSESANMKLRKIPWIEETYEMESNFMLVPPHLNPWATGSPSLVFSITRQLRNADQSYGVVEVQQDYEKIEKAMKRYFSFFNGKVMVLDDKKNQIYPLTSTGNTKGNNYKSLVGIGRLEGAQMIHQPDEMVYTNASEYTHWTVVMAITKEALFAKVLFIRNIIIAISCLIVITFLIAAIFISRRLAAPIIRLNQKVKNVTLDQPALLGTGPLFYVEEIDQLYKSFQHMLQRLRSSHDEILESHIREHKVYLKALQAQINPHFIYNSLATISTLGEEIGEPTIKKMCIQLSEMLRYTTSHNGPEVFIADEIRHAENYLRLLQVRFETSLEIEIQVEETLLQLPMPKLSLQPFVENAYIHGVNKILPPWKISVRGNMDNGQWTIRIADNGIGLTDERILQLTQKIAELDNKQMYPEINGFGGLGIENTYIRLKEFYGPYFHLSVSRQEEGGTVVILSYRKERSPN